MNYHYFTKINLYSNINCDKNVMINLLLFQKFINLKFYKLKQLKSEIK